MNTIILVSQDCAYEDFFFKYLHPFENRILLQTIAEIGNDCGNVCRKFR